MSDYVGDNKWIPKDETEVASERIVWSTKQVNDLLLAMDQGFRPKVAMPFYEGKQFLRKGNIVFEYTDEEVAELARCATDIVYFAEKYAVVMTDNGIQQVKLRDYQKKGVAFLSSNSSALLGDDMGLGKTVQAIVALKKEFLENVIKRTLLIVPNSLVSNWVREFSTWYPSLSVGILVGNRESSENTLKHSSSTIIATYEQIRIIFENPKNIGNFDYVIFDEAQRLKNSTSNVHQACKKIEAI